MLTNGEVIAGLMLASIVFLGGMVTGVALCSWAQPTDLKDLNLDDLDKELQ